MKSYLRALGRAYKAAQDAEHFVDAVKIREMWDNAVFEFAQHCSIDDYEWCKSESIKVASDFFRETFR